MQDEIKIHPLQQARKRLGIKQNVLADLTGLSTPTIKRAEHGDPLGEYSISQICGYFSMRYGRKVEPQELGLHCQWESEEALKNPFTQNQSIITSVSVKCEDKYNEQQSQTTQGETVTPGTNLHHILPQQISPCGGTQLFPEQLSRLERTLPELLEDTKVHFPYFWNVPYLRNPFFTGREELLTQLHEILCTKKTTVAVTQHALCGLGGIGKTQIALEYAYRYNHDYHAIFWVKADTRENLLTDFLSLAILLHLPECTLHNDSMIIPAIKQWLRANSAWLLIFDNADDLSLIQQFLPTGHQGHILLTTRAQALGGLAHHVDVQAMNQETGVLFLLRRARLITSDTPISEVNDIDQQLAQTLVQELGGLPLALDQAGAYIEETGCSLQEYLRAYQAHQHALLQRRGNFITDHPESVATTWSLSFDLVQKNDPIAADILRLCAFLDPDVIPEEILLAKLARLTLPHADQTSQMQLNEVLIVLLRFSLIRRNPDTCTITIHRLVQVMIREMMEKEERNRWRKSAIQVIQGAFPQPSTIYSIAGHPHSAIQILSASAYLYTQQHDKKQLATTLWQLAVQQQVIGYLQEADKNLAKNLALCREIDDWLNEAKTHQYLALLRVYQGLFADALFHLHEALILLRRDASKEVGSSVYAYYTLYYLHTKETILAHTSANIARDNAHEKRDIIRAEWLLGRVCLQRYSPVTPEEKHLAEAEIHLGEALQLCRQYRTVDYEADILLTWAQLADRKGDNQQAKKYARDAFTLAKKSAFNLLQADICNFLAYLELKIENHVTAKMYASTAQQYAYCDGPPYYYKSAILESERVLSEAKLSLVL